MKSHYDALADTDSFFQMTAFDETGVVGFQEMEPEQTNAFRILNEDWICRELEMRRTV